MNKYRVTVLSALPTEVIVKAQFIEIKEGVLKFWQKQDVVATFPADKVWMELIEEAK